MMLTVAVVRRVITVKTVTKMISKPLEMRLMIGMMYRLQDKKNGHRYARLRKLNGMPRRFKKN